MNTSSAVTSHHHISQTISQTFVAFSFFFLCFCVCVLQEDAQEEFGWKLVHGDVFRPPRKGMLLSVFLGSGTQIFIMTFVTLCECHMVKAPAYKQRAVTTCVHELVVNRGSN